MALNYPNTNTIANNPWTTSITNANSGGTTFNQMQHAIQGRMLTVTYVVSDYDMAQKPIDPMEIKMRLMNQLVEKMFEDKSIEFTKMQDMASGVHRFHARIFVVPDTQVRILRENKVATSLTW